MISKGLPKTRLNDTLNALNACATLGLDVQLKVLQALPSLLQNYSDDLKGDLLASGLQVCASLQNSRVQTVSGVATATLQQLVTAVFEKVAIEDQYGEDVPMTAEIPADDGTIKLRPAAYDAFRVFRDLTLAAEERTTKFVDLSSLSPEISLDLIWSCVNANTRLFASHAELSSIIRSNVLPLATRVLAERSAFPVTVRSLRILDLMIGRYMSRFPGECEVVLGLMTQSLEIDTNAPWKRVAVMEVVRNLFAHGIFVLDAYAIYDAHDRSKPIVQDLLSAFVRLSSEKPALIGLGPQSSIPISSPIHPELGLGPQRSEASSTIAGALTSAFGGTEVTGLSHEWSVPRSMCLDQLEKAEAPSLPETYIYTLQLECLASLSETVARIVLPLTVRRGNAVEATSATSKQAEFVDFRSSRSTRSNSFRQRAVPLHPLDPETGQAQSRVQAVAGLIDSCWPAILATSSTFLNATLDEVYYRNLIKSYQRFAQVAGLLRLVVPRDALMTTLSKSAVPPHTMTALASDAIPLSPAAESPRFFSNAKGILSVDSLVSQVSTLSSDRDRRFSVEPTRPTLTARNLLCLRALLNLAIALGPILGKSFTVVVHALRQADMILSLGLSQLQQRQGSMVSQKGTESPTIANQAFSAEVAAVEAAASRLLESTADYPDSAFSDVLAAFIALLDSPHLVSPTPVQGERPPLTPTPTLTRRTFSGLPGGNTYAELHARDYQFVVPKLGTLAEINIARFATEEPEVSGWTLIVGQLTAIASSNDRPREVRRSATDVLCSMAAGVVVEVAGDDVVEKSGVQQRALEVLWSLVDAIYNDDADLTTTDVEIHVKVLDTLRNVLERDGESLVAGWNTGLAIISTVFRRSDDAIMQRWHTTAPSIEWKVITDELVSLPLGRSAMTATQLICSDFLASLPAVVLPSVLETLVRFVCQQDDLNMALTNVTMMWAVADHLFGQASATEIDSFVSSVVNVPDFESQVMVAADAATPAQVFLALLSLSRVVQQTDKEVRNATFQSICTLLKTHGARLTPRAWSAIMDAVLLKILESDVESYVHNDGSERRNQSNDEDLTLTIILGLADVFSQHMALIEQMTSLHHVWELLLVTFTKYTELGSATLTAAVYTGLSRMLAQTELKSERWASLVNLTQVMWNQQLPRVDSSRSKQGNEDAHVAYLTAAEELYRHGTTPDVGVLIENIMFCVTEADGPRYGADVNTPSSIQSRALSLFKCIRQNTPSTESRFLAATGRFVVLPLTVSATHGPTFVALAQEAIEWCQALIIETRGSEDLIDVADLALVLGSLRRIIVRKYACEARCKGVWLWRIATSAVLALAEPVLELTPRTFVTHTNRDTVYDELVAIAGAIVSAHALDQAKDKQEIYNDQLFDIECYKSMRTQVMLWLDDPNLANSQRTSYCRSLFDASIIHALEPSEIIPAHGTPLEHLGTLRRGRAKGIQPTPRERMSYECLSGLTSLAISDTLASAAAPWLLLRLAIPIKMYIVDHSLRGRQPQPLSELEELLYCFDVIRTLKVPPRALGKLNHGALLYPLLIKAMKVATDKYCGAEEVLDPLTKVLEAVEL